MRLESPGLFDLQLNGYAGVDFNDPAVTAGTGRGDRRLDLRSRCLAYIRFLVDDPRDGLDRNASKLRNIVYRDFRHRYRPVCAMLRTSPPCKT